tara:strand:- start:3313 stop:4137 length:825 start_codon:yes stop_codon:yes gene_type:complete
LNSSNEARGGSTREKVLLVGAGGYIGQHTYELLSSSTGFDVVRWSRSLHGSFTDKHSREKVLDEICPDFLVNLAWQATNTERYEHSGGHQLWADSAGIALGECGDREIWCVLVGSALDAEPLSPEDTQYTAAKKNLKKVFDNHSQGEPATLLSPGYVFSLSDQRPRIVKSILTGRISAEFDLDRPDLALDFIEVRDVAAAIFNALEFSLAGRLVPFSGALRTVRSFYATVRERIGLPATAGTDQSIPFWPEEAESLLASGWRPTQTDCFFNKER